MLNITQAYTNNQLTNRPVWWKRVDIDSLLSSILHFKKNSNSTVDLETLEPEHIKLLQPFGQAALPRQIVTQFKSQQGFNDL